MRYFNIEDINKILAQPDDSVMAREPIDDPDLNVHPLDWAFVVGVDPEEVLGYNTEIAEGIEDTGEF